jgi:ABC-type polar amino acid transport system ATPase subunit
MVVTAVGGAAIAARVRDLTKTYGKGDAMVRALDGVTLDLAAGEFTAIMGPSGSGKSTLMHCCAALDTASSGEVFIGDRELGRLKDKELTRLRRDEIGFVFQSFNLVPTLSSNGWLWPGPSSAGPRSSLPTNQPATSTPSQVRRSSTSCVAVLPTTARPS